MKLQSAAVPQMPLVLLLVVPLLLVQVDGC
jgi:hypothetical protein